MKKIISGKMYNTETAMEIDHWENMSDKYDFYYYSETLYLKRTGEFFLYGYGGAASIYGRSYADQSYSGGEKIIPLTEQWAKAWLEEHSSADVYIDVFGDVEE